MSWMPSEESVAKRKKPSTVSSAPENYGRKGPGAHRQIWTMVYVLKLDAEAQTKFKSFLQNSFQNPHTLFVLIHDHAHWDLVRLDWLWHMAGLAFPFFE